MGNQFHQVLQAALQLPMNERVQLREALEDAELNPPGKQPPLRVPGLNRTDPRVLHDPEALLPDEYLENFRRLSIS